MKEKIRTLKRLIDNYEDELKELEDMVDRWNDFDDPGSDPGLQYEQENRVEIAYGLIVEYAKTL